MQKRALFNLIYAKNQFLMSKQCHIVKTKLIKILDYVWLSYLKTVYSLKKYNNFTNKSIKLPIYSFKENTITLLNQ